MKRVLFCIFLSVSFNLLAEGKLFVKDTFSHLYSFAAENASYEKTLVCGEQVSLIENKDGWLKVLDEKSKMTGFVLKAALSENVPNCFQEKYPEFFKELSLDNSDLYYWGKLGGRL